MTSIFLGRAGLRGESFGDTARRVGTIGGVAIASDATDAEVLDGIAEAAAVGVSDEALPIIRAEAIPNLIRRTPALLPRLRRAVAQARRGAGRSGIAFVGDSTYLGLMSAGGVANSKAASPPYQIADALAALGIRTDKRSFWSDGGAVASSTTLPTLDPRVTFGAGWASTGPFSLGGAMPANSTTTNALSFTPGGSFDTIDIYYVRNSGLATFTVNVDGGSTLATINSSGGLSVQKATVTCSSSATTINIQRNGTGTNAFIVGVDAYLSTDLGLAIWNMGACSSTTTNWKGAANAWEPVLALATVAPKAIFINLGINDARFGVSAATYKSNMQTLITACVAIADTILVVPVPSDTAITAGATQAAYVTAILEIGVTNNIPVLNLAERYVNYSTANAAGFMADQLHPSGDGYGDTAAAHLPLFTS